MTIRVLVADDHAIVREGVRLIIEREPDMEVVGEAVDGLEAVRLATTLAPDVVCIDLSMPRLDGLEATRRIHRQAPSVAVVALTVHDSDEYFFEMIRAGGAGYVLKGSAAVELVSAIRAAARGETLLHPALARRLVDDYVRRGSSDAGARPEGLTARETEILSLVGEGLSNREIAERLVIGLSTVQTHYANLCGKLGLATRAELVKYAIRHGLADLDG